MGNTQQTDADTNGKFPVSVVIVASNEERQIARVLGSVASWVNEIVVVTSDSRDRTTEIAADFGAKVFEHPWENYGSQVAWAMEQAEEEWILVLDADEEVSEELGTVLRRFLKEEAEHFDGLCMPRRSWWMGRWIMHGDWYPDRVTRLFRRGKGHSVGSSHGGIRVDGPVKNIKVPLNHYPFTNLYVLMRKVAHFAEYAYKEERHRWSLFSCLTRPLWRFFRSYVLRLGFLDGVPGLFVAVHVAYSTFVRHCRYYPRFDVSPRTIKDDHGN
ncbi:MAG: glycosyltransferase family 2 protein [Lentisphaerae bacterium]|nr:MAG: glycosyltransferase family 2 protein [Lentisphaerota bacterium]